MLQSQVQPSVGGTYLKHRRSRISKPENSLKSREMLLREIVRLRHTESMMCVDSSGMEGLKGEFFSFSCSFCPLICDFLEEPGVAFTLGFRGTRAGGSKVLEVTEVAVDTLYTTHWGIVEETSTASPRVVLRRAHRELAGGLHFFMSGSANCGLDRNVYIVVLGIILGLGLLPA